MKRLLVIAALLALPACGSAEARDLAAKNRAHLLIVHKASAPAGVDRATWDAAWEQAHRAAENLEKAVK